MKRFLKTATTPLLIIALCLTIFTICVFGIIANTPFAAYADSISEDNKYKEPYVEEEDLTAFYDSIDIVETELYQNNTSVLKELQEQLNYYNEKLTSGTYNSSKENIMNLINATENLITEYVEFENRNLSRAPYNPTYTPWVAAAIAFFDANDYYLASELLTHAKDNDVLNSTYTIEHTNIIMMASVYHDIAFGTSTSGSSQFEKTGNKNDNDTYYAIHEFDYKKSAPNSRTVTIIDVYDYPEENPYDGVEELVINRLYKAQNAGAIVPYKINQKISDITGVVLDKEGTTEYQETFDLSKTESRNYTVVFSNSNKLRIRICNADNSMSVTAHYFAWDNQQVIVSNNKTIDKTFEFTAIPNMPTAVTFFVLNVNMFKNNKMTIIFNVEG